MITMDGEHSSGKRFAGSTHHSSERARNTKQGLMPEAWENEVCFRTLEEA
jgi:hypothetical protein